MSLDLSPAPGSAPLARQVLAQAGMEARLLLRHGEQLLLAVVVPLVVLVGGVLAIDRTGLDLTDRPIDVLTPGVLALAVMSTAFTSLAIATGFERRYGVIKRLGASPLPRHGLLLGKVLALLLVELLQVVVVASVALAMDWSPSTSGVVPAAVTVLLGTAAFASLGLLVAGVLRAEATLAAANLVYLLLMAGGAVVVPAASYGGFGRVAEWLPSGALGEALRTALLAGDADPRAMMVLVAWAALGTVLTACTFRWE